MLNYEYIRCLHDNAEICSSFGNSCVSRFLRAGLSVSHISVVYETAFFGYNEEEIVLKKKKASFCRQMHRFVTREQHVSDV